MAENYDQLIFFLRSSLKLSKKIPAPGKIRILNLSCSVNMFMIYLLGKKIITWRWVKHRIISVFPDCLLLFPIIFLTVTASFGSSLKHPQQVFFAEDSLNYIFKSGDYGYQCFRIPALVTTKRGYILAFAEGRKNGCGDSGNIDLVMRRSVDGGRHWSPLQIVWSDGANTCGNPAPVVDRKSGSIFLLTTWNLGTDHERAIIDQTSTDTRRVYVLHSEDDGTTWTRPEEITKSVKNDNWTWYATGPGSGTQISKGHFRGRLIISCDHIEAATKKCFSHVIFSDDHGKTWKLGGSSPKDQVNESAVVALSDGTLMLNMRNYDGSKDHRQVATSDDGGISWVNLHADTELIEPRCQASMLRLKKRYRRRNYILFANPASTEKRENMTVKASSDEGRTWPIEYRVYRGPSAYSDLTNVTKNIIGILYEAGVNSAYEGIVWQEISVAELLNSKDDNH